MRKEFKISTIAVGIAISFSTAWAQSQNTSSVLPSLMIPQYSNQELQSVGCDPNNWNMLMNNYLAKRGYERSQQDRIQVVEQKNATPQRPPGQKSCFEGAISTINQTMRTVNQVISIFTGGGPDWELLATLLWGS